MTTDRNSRLQATWCVLQYYLVRSWGLGIHRFHGMYLMAIRFAPMNIKKTPATNRMNSERPQKKLLRHPCLRTNPRRQKRTCGHANTCCQYRMLLFRPLQQNNNLPIRRSDMRFQCGCFRFHSGQQGMHRGGERCDTHTRRASGVSATRALTI